MKQSIQSIFIAVLAIATFSSVSLLAEANMSSTTLTDSLSSTSSARYPIGNSDDPVTVTEFVTFLNIHYKTGHQDLTYYESFYPHYYARQYAITADLAYDAELMISQNEINKNTSSSTNSPKISWSYADTVDPKNKEKVNYTFSYAVNGNGDEIITDIASQSVAQAFKNERIPTAQRICDYCNDMIQDGYLQSPGGPTSATLYGQDAATIKNEYPNPRLKEIFTAADQLASVVLNQTSRFTFAATASVNAGIVSSYEIWPLPFNLEEGAGYGTISDTNPPTILFTFSTNNDCSFLAGIPQHLVVVPEAKAYRPQYILTSGITDKTPQWNGYFQINSPYIISNKWPIGQDSNFLWWIPSGMQNGQ